MSPDTAVRRGMPVSTSIRYWSARAHRAAARGDLRQRVAGELRRDHRLPARALHRQPLDDPQAGERGRLQQRHRREPRGRQPLDPVPRAERRDQARRHQVERDRADDRARTPSGAPSRRPSPARARAPARRGRARPRRRRGARSPARAGRRRAGAAAQAAGLAALRASAATSHTASAISAASIRTVHAVGLLHTTRTSPPSSTSAPLDRGACARPSSSVRGSAATRVAAARTFGPPTSIARRAGFPTSRLISGQHHRGDHGHAQRVAQQREQRVEDVGRRLLGQHVAVDRVEVVGAADADHRQQQQAR